MSVAGINEYRSALAERKKAVFRQSCAGLPKDGMTGRAVSLIY